MATTIECEQHMIQIDEMVLSVPGITAPQAGGLGQEIARLIAAGLPSDIGSHVINNIKIQIGESAIADADSMAATIARKIIQEINFTIRS